MFATNLILLLALIAMVGLAIWLFKDGEGVGPTPVSSIADAKKTAQRRLMPNLKSESLLMILIRKLPLTGNSTNPIILEPILLPDLSYVAPAHSGTR